MKYTVMHESPEGETRELGSFYSEEDAWNWVDKQSTKGTYWIVVK